MDFQGFLYRRIRTLLGKNKKEISLCDLQRALHLLILVLEVQTKTLFVICLKSVSAPSWGPRRVSFLSRISLLETPLWPGGLLSPRGIWDWGVPESRDTAHLVLLGTPHCQLPHPGRTFWILTKALRCARCLSDLCSNTGRRPLFGSTCGLLKAYGHTIKRD